MISRVQDYLTGVCDGIRFEVPSSGFGGHVCLITDCAGTGVAINELAFLHLEVGILRRFVWQVQKRRLSLALTNYANNRQFEELGESIRALPERCAGCVESYGGRNPTFWKFGYDEGQVDPAFAAALEEDPNAYAYRQLVGVDPVAAGYQVLTAATALWLQLRLLIRRMGGALGGTLAGWRTRCQRYARCVP